MGRAPSKRRHPRTRRVHKLFLISHVSLDSSESRKRGSPGGGQPAAADADLPQSGVIAPKVQSPDRTEAYQGLQERSAGSRRTPEGPGHPLWTLLVSNSSDTAQSHIFDTNPICPENSARRCGRRGQGSPGLTWLPWSVVAACSWKSTETVHEMGTARGIVAFQHSQKYILSMPGLEKGTHH